MKIDKILGQLNSFEKNSFLKIVDNIISNNPKNASEIEKILSDKSKELKNIDNINISRVFKLVEDEFVEIIKHEFINTTSQLDILIDIVIRDGNCIMKQDWFARLYDNEIKNLNKKIKELKSAFENNNSDIEELRKRDYKIYSECLNTAYNNDKLNNQDAKITSEEQTVLTTLSQQLELSQEEIKLINYMVVPIHKQPIGDVINELKNLGVVFYSKKNNTVYVADEIVRALRRVREKDVADKFFRRSLRLLREPQINLICKNHNINWRNPLDQKIKDIINEGVSFTKIFKDDIYKGGTAVTDKKRFINELCDKGLRITPSIKGVTIDEKLKNLIEYFDEVERDEKVGISIEGYEKLLVDLNASLPKSQDLVKKEFELQEENIYRSNYLLDYNIKPRDILEIFSYDDLSTFCKLNSIKTRGDFVRNILEKYEDAENLYLENFENIGFRNLSVLKENGLNIKESELGLKFEELTKKIFGKLGFNVDESLRKQLNNNKDKIDILISFENHELILIECKTIKESGFNKFSSVKRQIKSYISLATKHDYKVVKSLLVGPEFSDDFVKDVGLDYELNLSLITASSLLKILEGFKQSKLKQFPHNLLMKDVLIQEDRVLKAIER